LGAPDNSLPAAEEQTTPAGPHGAFAKEMKALQPAARPQETMSGAYSYRARHRLGQQNGNGSANDSNGQAPGLVRWEDL
jgi:hypothetical protein